MFRPEEYALLLVYRMFVPEEELPGDFLAIDLLFLCQMRFAWLWNFLVWFVTEGIAWLLIYRMFVPE
jgi:hypothetical protein